MAAAQVVSQDPVVPQPHAVAHPLCPLSASEITAAAALVASQWPADVDLRYKVVTLDEPKKAELLPYLEAEHSGSALPSIDRRVFVAYYIRNTARWPVSRVLALPLTTPRCRTASMRPPST